MIRDVLDACFAVHVRYEMLANPSLKRFGCTVVEGKGPRAGIVLILDREEGPFKREVSRYALCFHAMLDVISSAKDWAEAIAPEVYEAIRVVVCWL